MFKKLVKLLDINTFHHVCRVSFLSNKTAK